MQVSRFSSRAPLSTRRSLSSSHLLRHEAVRPCGAQKRVIEPVPFQEVFSGAAERIFGSAGFLKREETLVLVESVRSLEQAFMTLELIVRHLENRAGIDINDWHHRKKYYMRLCELSLRIERGPDVVFALFGNLQRFQISTYFGKEVIQRLGSLGAHPGILMRIAELCKLQKGNADKGVRSAYAELVQLLQTRNTPLDQEFLPKAKADMKALRNSVIKVAGNAPSMPSAPAGQLVTATAPDAAAQQAIAQQISA